MEPSPIDWQELLSIRRARGELGLSQAEFADLAGVSPRAIQSYEQGWRTPSPAVERVVLLLLLAERNEADFGSARCWESRGCAAEIRETCLSYQSRQGHLCWLLSGTKCEGERLRSWSAKKAACGRCDFMKRLVGLPRPEREP